MTPLETAGEEPANPVGGVGSPRRSDQGGRATRPASEGPGPGRRVRVSPRDGWAERMTLSGEVEPLRRE